MKLNAVAKAAVLALALSAGAAQADPVATVTLNGGLQFLQTGTVVNAIASGVSISRVQYSLGSAYVGGATWDSLTDLVGGGTSPISVPGATFSGFLSNGRHFQTVAWTGLNLTPGATWTFGPLDMDLVLSLAPLVIDQTTAPDRNTAMNNAVFSVTWSNGEFASIAVNSGGWSVTTTGISTTLIGAMPEPGSLALAGLGLLAAVVGAKRRGAAKA